MIWKYDGETFTYLHGNEFKTTQYRNVFSRDAINLNLWVPTNAQWLDLMTLFLKHNVSGNTLVYINDGVHIFVLTDKQGTRTQYVYADFDRSYELQ